MPEIRLIVSESNGIQLTEIGAACSENLIVTRMSSGSGSRSDAGLVVRRAGRILRSAYRPPRIIDAGVYSFMHPARFFDRRCAGRDEASRTAFIQLLIILRSYE